MERKNYNGIDLIKFICALLIVMIHVSPFGKAERFLFPNFFVQHFLARIAVPYFFIASGFLLYRKVSPDGFDPEPTIRCLKKLLRLYILWGIAYFPFKLERILGAPNGILYASVSCLRDYIFVGTFDHLWYLNASIVGILMVSFLLKKKVRPPVILCLGFVLYLIGLLAENWVSLIQPLMRAVPLFAKLLHLAKKVFVTTRNGIFEGFFFIAIGMAFARFPLSFSRKARVGGFLVSLIFLFWEAGSATEFGSGKAYDLYLFAAPAAFFLFAIARDLKLKESPVFPALRAMSSLLFYIHPMVILSFGKLAEARGLDIETNCTKFLLSMSVSLGLSWLIWQLSRQEKLRWLRKLYA